MSFIGVKLRHCTGTFDLQCDFTVPARGVIGLFGPSGSGKSTLLRCIAGLDKPRDAYIEFDNQVWHNTSTKQFIPPHRRAIGFVFQDTRLFPHLNVKSNLAYGLRRTPNTQRATRYDDIVDRLDLHPLLHRRPETLSGGERQRVAIGRALLTSPDLLLMDEPVSALDEASRREILPYLTGILASIEVPCIYVTHTVHEILQIAHTVVCLEAGKVSMVAPPHEALSAGLHRDAVILQATVLAHDDQYPLTALQTNVGIFWVKRVNRPVGSMLNLEVEANDVSLAHRPEPDSSLINQLRLAIRSIEETRDGQVRVTMASPEGGVLYAIITTKSRDHLALTPGQEIYARVKGTKLLI